LTRDERPPLAGGPALDPLGGTATYARVASLPVLVERCELLPLVRDTTSGFTKVSIVVRLSGGGHTGEGEDITWDQIDQIEFLRGGSSWLAVWEPHVRRALGAARPRERKPHGEYENKEDVAKLHAAWAANALTRRTRRRALTPPPGT
jgi:hypothetical protein